MTENSVGSLILLNPGPACTTDRVRAALGRGDWCHREPEFSELLASIRSGLTRVLNVGDTHEAIVVTRRVFLLTEEAVAAIREVSGVQSGRLEVGGTTTVGTYLLPRLLARFRDRHRKIECDIVVGNNGQIVKRLLDGELGVAIVAGQPGAPQLRTETVLDERLLLVAAPGHPLAQPLENGAPRGPLTPADLAAERFLLREPGSQTRDLQEAALIGWDLDDMAKADMWGPETIKQSVAAGLGISLISEHAIDSEVRAGRLAVLEVEPPLRSRPVVVAYRRDRLLSPAERAFLGLVRGLRTWPALDAGAGLVLVSVPVPVPVLVSVPVPVLVWTAAGARWHSADAESPAPRPGTVRGRAARDHRVRAADRLSPWPAARAESPPGDPAHLPSRRDEHLALAAALRREADQYPDERAEYLTEAAEYYAMAGEDAVAEELFQDALADGGGFSGSVHSYYAGFLLERGREDEALALIDAARKAKPDHAHVYAAIAETLDFHGHHRQAAAWATRGLVFLFGSLTDIEPADLLVDDDGRLLAADRLRARRNAGLPADHIDDVIAPGVDAHQRPEA